jgi:23S rRNA pseudouridine1911/1915/1917 synthase
LEAFLKQTDGIISSPFAGTDSEEGGEAAADVEWRTATIAASQHGARLDRALVDVVPEFSRSYLQQLIEAGHVALNGHGVRKASQRVKAGDACAIELRPTPQSQAFTPQAMALNVVFEDTHLMVIDKPAGLVVHPAPGNWSGTLLNGLLAFDQCFSAVPRAGIVHRLDKDTSGLMVVARTRAVMDALVQAIAARTVSRQYLALAHHTWGGVSTASVELPIGRDPRNRLRMAVVDLERTPGKHAKTDMVLLANAHEGCFVRCILHTGRTHQIRVHMASLGHPLIADVLYGGTQVLGMTRQALHACRLAFIHPVTGQSLVFAAQPPADFAGLLSEWGLSYNAA